MMKTKMKFTGQSNGDALGDRSRTDVFTNRGDAGSTVNRKTRILIVEDEPAMVAGLATTSNMKDTT